MQHAAMREAQGEEGQHWLVAHASQILLMVISTFIYTLCKRVIDEFANSAIQRLKEYLISPPKPKPEAESEVQPKLESKSKLEPESKLEPNAKPETPTVVSPPSSSPSPTPSPLVSDPVSAPVATYPSLSPAPAPAPAPEPIWRPPAIIPRPPMVPRPSPPSSRDTLAFEKKGQSVTITTLRLSLKYADVEHAAYENPVSIRRAGDTIVDTGIEHLLASLKPSHIKQVRAVLSTFGGDLEHLREVIMAQYLSSGGGSLGPFIEKCPASLQSEFQRVLRLKKNAATRQITAGIVLLGAHHYFGKFPNHLKKEWCRDLGLKVGGNAAELEARLMSHFFAEWETNAWLELRRSLVSRAHESYPVLSESEEEEDDDDEDDEDDDSAGLESDDEQPLSTWADKIEWVLQQYVGEATLSEIYCDIEGEFPEDIAGKPNWRAAVRSCLSTNTRKGRFVVEDTPDGRAWRLGH